MERIRKALDLARAQRPQGSSRAEGSTAVSPGDIRYTRTRVFTPSPQLLENNRIIAPSAADPAAAAFRMLRTQVLQRMDAHGWRTLAIFSPTAGDGKSTTAINLALSIGSDKQHTALVVDCDFRRPTIAARFGLAPDAGVDDLLTTDAAVADCLYHPDGFDRIVVMPARGPQVNSAEILAGPRSAALVAELRARYPDRVILFDLPPVLSSDDALGFAPLVDCGLVVAAAGRTRRQDLATTMELLEKTAIVGTVLNRAADTSGPY